MGKKPKYIPRDDWQLTQSPYDVKKKIWELSEKPDIAYIIKYSELHPDEHIPHDRKTIKRVNEEFWLIKAKHLVELPPDILYYVLKRRPELVTEANLQPNEVEKIRLISDENWNLTKRQLATDRLPMIGKKKEIIPPATLSEIINEAAGIINR